MEKIFKLKRNIVTLNILSFIFLKILQLITKTTYIFDDDESNAREGEVCREKKYNKEKLETCLFKSYLKLYDPVTCKNRALLMHLLAFLRIT